MKDLFVPYEIAVKLKEKGFDKPCLKVWSKKFQSDKECKLSNDFCIHNWNEYSGSTYSAPLWQQAISWINKRFENDDNYIYIMYDGFFQISEEETIKYMNKALDLI